jgi:hypothetical protein
MRDGSYHPCEYFLVQISTLSSQIRAILDSARFADKSSRRRGPHGTSSGNGVILVVVSDSKTTCTLVLVTTKPERQVGEVSDQVSYCPGRAVAGLPSGRGGSHSSLTSGLCGSGLLRIIYSRTSWQYDISQHGHPAPVKRGCVIAPNAKCREGGQQVLEAMGPTPGVRERHRESGGRRKKGDIAGLSRSGGSQWSSRQTRSPEL